VQTAVSADIKQTACIEVEASNGACSKSIRNTPGTERCSSITGNRNPAAVRRIDDSGRINCDGIIQIASQSVGGGASYKACATINRAVSAKDNSTTVKILLCARKRTCDRTIVREFNYLDPSVGAGPPPR